MVKDASLIRRKTWFDSKYPNLNEIPAGSVVELVHVEDIRLQEMGLMPGNIFLVIRGGTPCIIKNVRNGNNMVVRGDIQCILVY